jgi:hypothetical protein
MKIFFFNEIHLQASIIPHDFDAMWQHFLLPRCRNLISSKYHLQISLYLDEIQQFKAFLWSSQTFSPSDPLVRYFRPKMKQARI